MDSFVYFIIGFVVLLSAFAVAVWRWGADSRDQPDSQEWARRQEWFGRGHRHHVHI